MWGISGAALASPADGDKITILALGDSLTAGYGLDKGLSFPDKLELRLKEMGINATIINGGVSGDTSAGGLARLSWLLDQRFDAVIINLGANDGLRGLDPSETKKNIGKILKILDEHSIPALLAGMQAPPNLGADYVNEFNSIYPDLAQQFGIVFYPFFLEGVAAIPELNQPDGIHPNALGVDLIVEKILPNILQLVEQIKSKSLKK